MMKNMGILMEMMQIMGIWMEIMKNMENNKLSK
jgi:hypothetical protein